MSRVSRSILATLPLSFVALTVTSGAYASSYGEVNKAEWTGGTTVPDHISMFMATPDVMPVKPPIVVNLHACGGNSANSQWAYQGFDPLKAALDSVGFIMILPQQTRNCFDSGSEGALTRGGNDDLSAIVQMVQYVIDTHNADPTRVYVMGGSGGGIATQALLAVYPDVFKAGHARAGAPAGCWGVSYNEGQQWSDPCASGSVDKTPQEWGELVRSYYPDYTGPRPRVQINQGNNDGTISFNNFQEGIDEWTNVLGLSAEPTSTKAGVVGANTFSNGDPAPHTYDIEIWNDECGYPVLEMWEALGNGHSMGYEAQHILEFFGLDQTRDQDPWDEMCGDFVDPGTGGAGAGGSDAGVGGADPGAGGADPGAGGADPGAGGAGPGAGGAVAAGGSDAGGSNFGTGAADSGVGGASAGGAPIGVSTGGTSSGGAGVAPSSGGNGVGAGDSGGAPAANSTSKGCSFVPGPSAGGVFAWALVLLGFGLRRRRTSKS